MSLRKELCLLTKPYYWLNLLMALSYIVAKKTIPICNRVFRHNMTDEICELDGRETEILFFLLIVIMIRSRKTGSVTMVNYLSSSFIYTKVANAILWAYSDFRYGLGFLAVCILIGSLFTEPIYKGPEQITYFRSIQAFDDELQRDKHINWLICFYTMWNPSCVNFAPIFAELSNEYALDNLRFGKVDIGRFSELGLKYRISTSSFSKQLPTLILFQNGNEILRHPMIIDSKGRVQKFFFSADNVRAAFNLNNLYKQCVENSLKFSKSQRQGHLNCSGKKVQ